MQRLRQMNLDRILIFVLAFLSGGLTSSRLFAHDLVPGAPQGKAIVLQGGDLYTVASGVLENTDLLFEQGQIQKIGPALEVPEGAEVIDLRGKRVYPGIIAPQTTLGLIEIGAVRATNDRNEVGDWNPEAAAHIAYNPDSEILPTVRSHGITTVQVVPQGKLLRGSSMLVHLDGWNKEDAALRLVDGVALSWPPETINRSSRAKESPEKQKENLEKTHRELRDVFQAAQSYHHSREGQSESREDARWEAMRPLFTGELPLFIQANDQFQILQALAFAREWEVRVILVGAREADKVLDLLQQEQVPVILQAVHSLPSKEDDAYDSAYRLAAQLHQAGVPFCLAQPGESWDVRNLPFQAGHAAAYGLPEEVALRSITLSTAEILGIDDLMGSLQVGKDATLFVSEGDVMDMLTQKVTHMWIQGRPVDLDNRHKRLFRKYDERPVSPH